MRTLVPIAIAGTVLGLAFCDAWPLCLSTLVAAFVAYSVGRAVKEQTK